MPMHGWYDACLGKARISGKMLALGKARIIVPRSPSTQVIRAYTARTRWALGIQPKTAVTHQRAEPSTPSPPRPLFSAGAAREKPRIHRSNAPWPVTIILITDHHHHHHHHDKHISNWPIETVQLVVTTRDRFTSRPSGKQGGEHTHRHTHGEKIFLYKPPGLPRGSAPRQASESPRLRRRKTRTSFPARCWSPWPPGSTCSTPRLSSGGRQTRLAPG